MRILFALTLFTFATSALAEDYFCIADAMAGFKYNKSNKKWEQSFFFTDNKYVISKAVPDDAVYKLFGEVEYKVTIVGEKETYTGCKKGFENGFLHCASIGEEFTFNKNNGRYMSVYTIGYLQQGEPYFEGAENDTPNIEIGKCSPL